MGGGWREAPFELRVTRRERLPPDTARNDLGLRCAIDPGEDE
jgi:formylglycine-generating enzyme required for sulfatase activity